MLRKLASSALAIALAIAGLVATNTPAQAAGTGDQGSIYYIGSWIGADWQGIRRYDLATGDDMRLDLDSPTCSGLAGSSTSGLAVDLAHKRLYWTATDGTAGVFAMDLSIGKCYALELDTSPRGIAISDDGETLNWTDRVYDPAQGIYVTELHTLAVADLELIAATNPSPGVVPVDLPGFSDISVSDLEMHNGRMYMLLDATEDASLSTHNFIYSYDPNNLSIAPVQEADTGVIGTPYQFQIGSDSYFVSTGDQIYRVPFGNAGATWGMMLNQISGFALVGDNIYSAFNRDEPMKVFNINNDVNPRPLDENPPVDLFSYLVYAPPMSVPNITASSTDSSGGNASVPFDGVTVSDNETIGYSVVPRDGSAPFGGFCTLTGNSCGITGLDDNMLYDVTLRYAYTYLDSSNETHVIVASGPSNSAQINHVPAPTITTTSVHSSNGGATIGFGNTTLSGDYKLHFVAVPRDGSANVEGFCTVSGTDCQLSGLDSTKEYDVTLRKALTYDDPSDLANPVKIYFESASSNSAHILLPGVDPVPNHLKATKTVTGFAFEKSALTTATKNAIKAWLNGKTGFTKVTCVGYTGYNYNKRSTAYLTKLALARAANVCAYIHSLKPSIAVTAKTAKRDTSKKDATRRVLATITN